MIRESAWLIRVIQKYYCPGTLDVAGRLDELCRSCPHRRDVFIHETLHRGNQGAEVNAEWSRRLVKTGDRGRLALIKRSEFWFSCCHISSLVYFLNSRLGG